MKESSKLTFRSSANGYVCTECGSPAPELFKTYGEGILKLTECMKCGKSVDKYVEYDATVLCLDLLLLKKSAYRHFLFNAEGHQSQWKLLLFLIIFEAFRQWKLSSGEPSDATTDFSDPPWEFYISVFKVTLDVIIFVAFVVSLSHSVSPCRAIVNGFVLASFGQLLTVVAALWNAGRGFVFMASFFSLACQAQAHSVVTGWPLGVSLPVILLGFSLTFSSPWRDL